MPSEIQAPTLRDGLGQGDLELRRQWTRTLRRWELTFDGQQERLEEIAALLDYAQGDTEIFFDGAGTLDIVQPVLIAIGNGTQTQFNLLHKNVFTASTIIYVSGSAMNNWSPLGGDGVSTMDKIVFSSAPANYSQIKAKYRRKAKVVIQTDQAMSIQRVLRMRDNPNFSIYSEKIVLQELPK